MTEAYHLAQKAIADLKAAVRQVLERAASEGMTNVEIGRTLGIYGGHSGQVGHISRTILAVMESEGVVAQDATTKRWSIRVHNNSCEREPNQNEAQNNS